MFCDPFLAYGGMVYSFATVFLPIPLAILTLKKFPDSTGVVIVLAIVALFNVAVLIWVSPRFYSFIIFDNEGIQFNEITQKSIKKSYGEFPVIKIAYYTHFFSNRYFLILSSRLLTPFELSHVNQITVSEDCIKIKIGKRRYKKLLRILPVPQIKKLKSIIEENDQSGINVKKLAEMQMKKETQQERKKQSAQKRHFKNKKKMGKTKRKK